MNWWRRFTMTLAVAVAAIAGVAAFRASAFRESAATSSTAKRINWLVPMQLDRPLLEQLAAEFRRANPDIDLRLEFVPGAQYQPKLKTLIAARQPPDMFYCGDVWVAYLLPFLKDLSPLFARDAAEIDLEDVYPQVLTACRFNGEYRFAPRWFTVPLLYYNTKVFDDAHEPYPAANWTWTEYLAAAKRLTKLSPDGRTTEIWGTQIVTGWWGEWLTLVRQSGGELFDAAQQHCLLDQPAAERGMQFYFDKVWKERVSPPPGRGPDQGFASGKLAMELVGHTGNWRMFNQIGGLQWDIQVLPSGPASQSGGEMALEAIGVSKDTPHPEACWRFLKFMMSRESIRAHVDAGYLSIRKSVAQETHLSPSHTSNPHNVAAAYEALAQARSMPHSPDFIEIAMDVIQPEIDRLLDNPHGNVDEACRRATRAANEFIETLGTDRRARAPGQE